MFAGLIFLGCIVSPPSLMDDVDAVQAQISRNMLDSGDWTIARLDGVPYLEKSPLIYWLMALAMRVFGPHDWAARVPVALAAILLSWATARYGRWAFGERAGFYAGLTLSTCLGLFLFTRIQIPDVMLTLSVCMSVWSFQRAIEEEEAHSRRWALLMAVSLGIGLLLKGLIAIIAPAGGVLVYLAICRQLFSRKTWRRLHVPSTAVIVLLIAAPWHVLATIRMPPYFDLTMLSASGQYHGFFWFYFINEHVLRFLNVRYPRDYNTVPRLNFWILHLLWLFPWSVYFPAAVKLGFKPVDRAGRTRLLALCCSGFLLVFFTFSTTQEYYSMPIYPALALLLGSAMASGGRPLLLGTRSIGVICTAGIAAIGWILFEVRSVPTPGDISTALEHHPEAYSLSLGHMGDLTIQSFAYLRGPLIIAGVALLAGAIGGWILSERKAFLAFATMMVLFIHASRMALVVFDPYLSSRALAEALIRAPEGRLIVDGEYYPFSSVFFYTGRTALLLNGRSNNLEYGSYAPGAAEVFIADTEFIKLWTSGDRYYILTTEEQLARLRDLTGADALQPLAASGGKFLFTNHPTEVD
jgi:4-amino-4-deoxy-L-arabinose transferase-like glycosyltransferase